jgi:hypothetical protein
MTPSESTNARTPTTDAVQQNSRKSCEGESSTCPIGEFGRLQLACAGHTNEQMHPDITVQTCWDADRLDLGRVGIMPEPTRLCTAAAKRPEMLKWADGRACFGVVPKLVMDDWRIDVNSRRWTPNPALLIF